MRQISFAQAAKVSEIKHVYEVRPRKDHLGIEVISDALQFGRLWQGEPIPRHILVTQLFGRCFLRTCGNSAKRMP